MNTKKLISLSNKLLEEAESENPTGVEAALFAKAKIAQFPEIKNANVHELISDCAINPTIVSGLANPRFGEPSIIVSESDNWVFEVISWRHMVTAIHEHSYYGAFKALEGKRLHFTFSFEDTKAYPNDKSLKLGRLSCTGFEEIQTGEVNLILKEREFIHSVWPLSANCSTIVFRQKGPSNSWSYLPKKITYDERLAERYLKNRLRYLRDLQLYSSELYSKTLLKLIERAPYSVIVYLIMALNISVKDPLFMEIYKICSKRDFDFAEAVKEITDVDELFRDVYRLKTFSNSVDENKSLAATFYSKILDKQMVARMLPVSV